MHCSLPFLRAMLTATAALRAACHPWRVPCSFFFLAPHVAHQVLGFFISLPVMLYLEGASFGKFMGMITTDSVLQYNLVASCAHPPAARAPSTAGSASSRCWDTWAAALCATLRGSVAGPSSSLREAAAPSSRRKLPSGWASRRASSGLPPSGAAEVAMLEREEAGLRRRCEEKERHLRDLLLQKIAMENLIHRNKTRLKPVPDDAKIRFCFLLVNQNSTSHCIMSCSAIFHTQNFKITSPDRCKPIVCYNTWNHIHFCSKLWDIKIM